MELKRLREAAEFPLERVAREMVWSLSKIVRIESGTVGISVNDVKALAALYDVGDPEAVSDLVTLAAGSRQRMWWGQFRDKVPGSFLEFIGLEHDASRIIHYHPSVVPGLVQTEEYARSVTGTESAVEPSSQIAIRMRRQDRLFRDPNPPGYVVVFDESALYRRFGDSTVLRDQLNALLDHAREPHIELYVIPTDSEGYPAVSMGFVILEFPDERDLPIVFYDQPGSDVATDSPVEVERYFQTFDQMRALALHGADAIAAIKAARDKAT